MLALRFIALFVFLLLYPFHLNRTYEKRIKFNIDPDFLFDFRDF
jgi:hypothetical protein